MGVSAKTGKRPVTERLLSAVLAGRGDVPRHTVDSASTFKRREDVKTRSRGTIAPELCGEPPSRSEEGAGNAG